MIEEARLTREVLEAAAKIGPQRPNPCIFVSKELLAWIEAQEANARAQLYGTQQQEEGKPVGEQVDFSQALQKLRCGHRMCREGWNGKGMYVFLIGGPNSTCQWLYSGSPVHPVQPFLAMKTADNTVVPWLVSQSCLLASDWEEYVPDEPQL